MNERRVQGTLELNLTDFGPIAKAELDLRPLTVFVGPSNTGKSYLAILIYALHRYFSEVVWPSHRRYYRQYRKPSADRQKNLTQKAMDALVKALEQRTRVDKLSDSLPPEIVTFIRSRFDAFKRGDEIGNEIIRCFGIDDLKALVRKGCGQGAIVMRRHFSNHSKSAVHTLVLRSQGAEFTTKIPKGMAIQIDAEDESEVEHLVDSMEEHDDFFCMAFDRNRARFRPASRYWSTQFPRILSSRGPDRRHACAPRSRQRRDRQRVDNWTASRHPYTHAFGRTDGFPSTNNRTRPAVGGPAAKDSSRPRQADRKGHSWRISGVWIDQS